MRGNIKILDKSNAAVLQNDQSQWEVVFPDWCLVQKLHLKPQADERLIKFSPDVDAPVINKSSRLPRARYRRR
jgi:hypothetical protein